MHAETRAGVDKWVYMQEKEHAYIPGDISHAGDVRRLQQPTQIGLFKKYPAR